MDFVIIIEPQDLCPSKGKKAVQDIKSAMIRYRFVVNMSFVPIIQLRKRSSPARSHAQYIYILTLPFEINMLRAIRELVCFVKYFAIMFMC